MTKATYRYAVGKVLRWLGWHSDWLRPVFYGWARRIAPTDFERAMDELAQAVIDTMRSVGQGLVQVMLAANQAMAKWSEALTVVDTPDLDVEVQYGVSTPGISEPVDMDAEGGMHPWPLDDPRRATVRK